VTRRRFSVGARSVVRRTWPLVLLAAVTCASSGGVLSGCSDDETLPKRECSLDCNDGNPCTLDFCIDDACRYEPAELGKSCGATEGDLCTGIVACDGQGECVQAGAPEVDDGDSCTVDTCDVDTGEVTHDRAEGCIDWQPMSTDGALGARERHTAVWTGDAMLIWGGAVDGDPSATNTGARYDPEADEWTAMSVAGAPAARSAHSAVWTGSHMLVWGGFGLTGFEAQGGVYDPATDSWTAMTLDASPAGRVSHSTVWTGSQMVVWGGTAGGPLADGAAYDPLADSWTTLPAAGAPSPRFRHSATWTGDSMVVWGGNNLVDWRGDGAILDASLTWVSPTSVDSIPIPREQHTSIWTGQQVVVWGGFTGGNYEASGGSFDPAGGAAGTWSAISSAGAPEARVEHIATWTGTDMFIWGGCGTDSCQVLYGNGALWRPGAGGGAWTAVDEHAALSPRRFATVVWTGEAVIVWGGEGKGGLEATGARAAL